MTPEFNPMSPELEGAVAEVRDDAPDPAVVEAAAARVWAHLSQHNIVIRSCADFQELIPDFRAGRLPEARTVLVRDHLHQCVACRRIYEGKVVPMPMAPEVRRPNHAARWALAASVLIVAGSGIWWAVTRNGENSGHATVQLLDGTLYTVTADGLHPLLKGQPVPSDVELRTAKDSDAILQLADGSQVEMRERSSLSTSASALDLTIRLERGSVIVQATHRTKGHLYVDTGDCRVAVTGTLFGVTAGVKGSRVSVVQGEVHVLLESQERILHAGDQTVTSTSVDPEPVSESIGWSRNRVELLSKLRAGLAQVKLPAMRYSSSLLDRLPANTKIYVSIPNLEQYLTDAESVLSQRLTSDPELGPLWNSHISTTLESLRTASDYLGDEIDIVDDGQHPPVLVAQQKRTGFDAFLRSKGLQFTVESHDNLLLFGPDRTAVDTAVTQLDSGFAKQPLYARIAQSYKEGAGLLVWIELGQQQGPLEGARYFSAESKQAGDNIVGSATLGFDGPRTGLAAQLAPPSSMGSLDYISPDALAMLGFVLKDPGGVVDATLAITQGSAKAAQQTLDDERQEKGFNVRDDLAASLGGEFSIALDGSLMPVPSWKLVSEVYDPERFRAALQHFADAHNQELSKTGKKPIVTGQETVDGRVYYSFAQSDSGPLLEAHYTFDQGYLVAAPTRALVTNALQIRQAGTSIKHSGKFLAMIPRDQHVNFSAVVYQNIGTSLAPLAALAGALIPQRNGQPNMPFQNMGNVKPTLFAVYGEPDRITMRANGDVLASTLEGLLSGNLRNLAGIGGAFGQMNGTREQRNSYAVK
jgi:hypothetical protein